MALRRRQTPPRIREHFALGDAFTVCIHGANNELGYNVPLISSFAEPLERLALVLGNAIAGVMFDPQCPLSKPIFAELCGRDVL